MSIGIGTKLIPIKAIQRRQSARIRELAHRFPGFVKEARKQLEHLRKPSSIAQKSKGVEECEGRRRNSNLILSL
jgi:hypothetical protein